VEQLCLGERLGARRGMEKPSETIRVDRCGVHVIGQIVE
jgi:hypothetical protein